jgi:hypothetical protein
MKAPGHTCHAGARGFESRRSRSFPPSCSEVGPAGLRRSPDRASAQASSHRRHSSAQMRQCSWCCAWRSHSSPALRQASIHASRTPLARSGTNSVCLVRTRPVDTQTSLQFRQSVMHASRVSRSGSPRFASAHAVQVWAQTKHSSMHAAKTPASIESARRCVSSICCARDMIPPLVSALTSRYHPRLTSLRFRNTSRRSPLDARFPPSENRCLAILEGGRYGVEPQRELRRNVLV